MLDKAVPTIGLQSLSQMKKAIIKYFCINGQADFQTMKFMRDFSHLESSCLSKIHDSGGLKLIINLSTYCCTACIWTMLMPFNVLFVHLKLTLEDIHARF